MAKLQSLPTVTSSSIDLSIIGSICILITLVVSILGIKLKWFRHRLTFEGVPTAPAQENNRNENEVVLLSGVFRRNEDFDSYIDIQQPKILPPVRISNQPSSSTSGDNATKLILPKPKTKRAPDIPNGNFTPVEPTIPLAIVEDNSIQKIYPNERFIDNIAITTAAPSATTSFTPNFHIESETTPPISTSLSTQEITFKKVVPKPPERLASLAMPNEPGASNEKSKLPPPPPYQYKDPLKEKKVPTSKAIQTPVTPEPITTPIVHQNIKIEDIKAAKLNSPPLSIPVPPPQPVKITDGPYFPTTSPMRQHGKKKDIVPAESPTAGPSKRGFFGLKSKSTEPKQSKKAKPPMVRVLKQPKPEKIKDKTKEKSKEKEKSKDKKKAIASTVEVITKPKETPVIKPGVTFAAQDIVIPAPMERTSGIDYRFDYNTNQSIYESDKNNNSKFERNLETNNPIMIKYPSEEVIKKPGKVVFIDYEGDEEIKKEEKEEEIDSWNMIARHKQNISHNMAAQLEAKKAKMEQIKKQKNYENALQSNNNAKIISNTDKDQTFLINRPKTIREMQNEKKYQSQPINLKTNTQSNQHNSDTEA